MTAPATPPSAQFWPDRHYAYCRDRGCDGCLPTDAALSERPRIGLWGEMVARCIAQTPDTKTHAGALAAIVEDGDHYRELSEKFRRQRIAADYWGPPPIPVPNAPQKWRQGKAVGDVLTDPIPHNPNLLRNSQDGAS